MTRTPVTLLAALALTSLTACERTSEPAPAPAPATTPPPAATTETPPAQPSATAAGGIIHALGLTFTIPQGWNEVPPANSMRLAQLEIPGDAAPVTVIFTSAGGDVQANLDRWAAQFTGSSDPAFDTREVSGLTIHTAAIDGGTYRNMGDPPQENFALRGAIIPTPAGSLFIKMTGPAEQIARNEDALYDMLNSVRRQ